MLDRFNQKKKCSRICYPYVGDTIGGAQLSGLTLIRNLPPEVTPVLVLHEEGPLANLLKDEAVPYQPLPLPDISGQHTSPLRQIVALARTAPRLIKFLKAEKIDIIHTQDGRMHMSWWLAAKLTRTPHIWHQRSHFAFSRLQNFMMDRVTKIVAISNAVVKSMPPGIQKRSTMILNPVAPSVSQTAPSDCRREIIATATASNNDGNNARNKTGRNTASDTGDKARNDRTINYVVIAAVGNLRAVKQPLLLARSVVEAARHSDAPLILALFGEDRGDWLARMRHILDKPSAEIRIAPMGFRHPIGDWLGACDIMLATSNGDAFGRTLVEAMGVNLPVIAVDAGGHPEIINNGHDGLLVPDGNAAAIGATLSNLANDPDLRKRLIENGQDRFQQFSPARHVEQILDVYSSVT